MMAVMQCDKNILKIFHDICGKYGDNIAVIGDNYELTYHELNQKANQIAKYLHVNGVNEKSAVGIYLPRSIEMIVTALAIIKLGAHYVPLPINAPENHLGKIVKDANIKIVITDNVDNNLSVKNIDINLAMYKANYIFTDLLNVNIDSYDIAYITYTSGTTGHPKGVVISHKSIVSLVRKNNFAKITSNDVLLQLSAFEFDGSTFEIWGALLNGATLVLMPAGYPVLSHIAELINKNKISILFLTTQLFNSLVDHRLEDILKVQQILFGGEVASISHVKKFLLHKYSSTLLSNIYGPTECTAFSTFYPISNLDDSVTSIPIGKAISGAEIYIVDEDLNLVSEGEVGELLIGGSGVAICYANDQLLTRQKFVEHSFGNEENKIVFRTGDMAMRNANGDLLFMGRKDRLIKIRGQRISLEMIENELLKYSTLRSVAVDCRENHAGEKYLYAWIRPVDKNFEIKNLQKFLAGKLPSYMIPNYYFIVNEIPLKENGKIDYKRLN